MPLPVGVSIALVIHSFEGSTIALAIHSLDPRWGFQRLVRRRLAIALVFHSLEGSLSR